MPHEAIEHIFSLIVIKGILDTAQFGDSWHITGNAILCTQHKRKKKQIAIKSAHCAGFSAAVKLSSSGYQIYMKIALYPKYLIRSLFVHGRHRFFKAGYKVLYPEYSRHGMTPWQHYVIDGKRKGFCNGNCPSDRAFFREGYELEYPDVQASGYEPWRHFAEKGHAEGRDNGLHPDVKLFFPEGYLLMYPETAQTGLDPWHHYVLKGKVEGRDNGLHPDEKEFFAEGYLEMYSDVSSSGLDAWHHYVLIGRKQGRDNGLHPAESLFLPAGYLVMYPEVEKSKADPWKHYVLHGKKNGYDNGHHPNDDQFFKEGYLQNYPDILKIGMDPWQHYVIHGRAEGRNNGTIGLNFCAEGYLLNCPEVRKAGIDPWRHFVLSREEREKRNYLNDYSMRIAGHEQEFARTVYLSPQRFNYLRNKNIKKVLLIGHEFSVSGAPAALLGIAKILVSDGYLVDIAVSDRIRPAPLHLYDGIGADVFLIPDSTECFPCAEHVLVNYDLVVVNTIVMASYAALSKKLGVPHIWFVHEDLPAIKHFCSLSETLKNAFFDDCQNIVCVSKYVIDCLYGEYKIRFRYLNNFVNDISALINSIRHKKTEPFEDRVRTFAVVGSVESRKAQDSAISAFLYLAENPQYKGRWKLYLIGKSGRDSLDPELGIKLKSATRNVPDIEWCGQVTEHKWELFSRIDFFIVPSLEESSSLVTIEAAMLGKPVIVTSHVGAKYLADNNGGFIFEPGDKTALRNLIGRCIDMSEGEYRRMGRQIRLNYEKTSTFPIYHKELSSIVSEALTNADAASETVRNGTSAHLSLRDMGNGANIISADRVEYVNCVDFSCLQKPCCKRSDVSDQNAVGVVVPVFNGVAHLRVLLPSLFRNTDIPHKFVFVDDCSGAETADFLKEAVKGRDDCILIRNEKNLGFVRSVNRGAEKALESCSSFVMLNSDTEVPSGWLGRLMKPIFDDEKISSVTPLSNRATVFSFPFFDSEKDDRFLKEFGVEGINKAIQKSLVDEFFDIPTGHGFCMAISGKVWKKIGGLNSELFGRGYGEENEWSLRAELDGYRNILLPSLYIAHHEKGSFTNKEREANCASAQEIISVMFPSYISRVQNYVRERPSSASMFSVYLTLAVQRGYKAEIFTDPSLFLKRMSGDEGIFVIKEQSATKIAVKLLGEVMFVGNVRNIKAAGVLPDAQDGTAIREF